MDAFRFLFNGLKTLCEAARSAAADPLKRARHGGAVCAILPAAQALSTTPESFEARSNNPPVWSHVVNRNTLVRRGKAASRDAHGGAARMVAFRALSLLSDPCNVHGKDVGGRRPRNVVDIRRVLSRRRAVVRQGGPAPQFLAACGCFAGVQSRAGEGRGSLNRQKTARQEASGRATGTTAPGMAPARALSYPSDGNSQGAPEARLEEVSACPNDVVSSHAPRVAAGWTARGVSSNGE